MLPPVLEIYVVWHPGDAKGRAIADEIVDHFHGTSFTGLIGGAIEVYFRSAGWQDTAGAPRPIAFPGVAPINGVEPARFIAVVPIIGNEMAIAVEAGPGPWRSYLEDLVGAREAHGDRVRLYPYGLDAAASDGTRLGSIFAPYQRIASGELDKDDIESGRRCRDLAQGIAQDFTPDDDKRLIVFISHTKRSAIGDDGEVADLIAMVRNVIGATRLREFFDANDLQPGRDWDNELRSSAAKSALLSLRTDLYPRREWCQKEVLIAKRAGMPVVTLDALGLAEERGSFLMDHVPRVPVRANDGHWRRTDVFRGLDLLVDECLKRVLWFHQKSLAQDRPELAVSWWASHAPEPVTLVQWLEDARANGWLPEAGKDLRILHPDPPLGPDEKTVLDQMIASAGLSGKLDIMTPRLLAARGG